MQTKGATYSSVCSAAGDFEHKTNFNNYSSWVDDDTCIHLPRNRYLIVRNACPQTNASGYFLFFQNLLSIVFSRSSALFRGGCVRYFSRLHREARAIRHRLLKKWSFLKHYCSHIVTANTIQKVSLKTIILMLSIVSW